MTTIRVGPEENSPTHDIALSSKSEKWGLKLDGGIRAVQEISQTPSTLDIRGGGGLYGTGDPTFTERAQDTWHAGMLQERFEDNPARFYHGRYLWSSTPGRLSNGLLWKWAEGDYRDYNMHQPGSVSFHKLISAKKYYASKFTVAAQDTTSYDADKAYILVRRRGNPGTLTAELWTDSAGSPDAIIATITATATVSDITDIVSQWHAFDWTGTTTLTHGTDYWVVVYGAAADSARNCWEVGVDTSGSASKISTDGSSWSAASSTMYYRAVDADSAQKWHGARLYKDDGTLVMLAINQPSSGDSDVYEWDETNDEYDALGTITGNDLSNPVYDVAVSKNIVFMARSTTENIYQLYDNSGTWTGYDDATAGNKADRLHAFNDPVDGPQLWRGENDTWYVSRADVPAAGANAAFGDDIELPNGYDILDIADYNDQVWARTQDALYSIKNDKPAKLAAGIDAVVESKTRDMTLLASNLFLYFPWAFSVERLYGGTLDDVGPWKGSGLPDGYQGKPSSLTSVPGYVIVGVDGGTSNKSSVLVMAEGGNVFHPIWEAWETGQRVRNVWVQPQTDDNNMRLWISVGTDLVHIDFPDESLNPLKDSNQEYVWESVIETSSHDMGRATWPKLFKALDIVAKNLGENCSVGIDYQLDDDVGGSSWVDVTELYQSPRDRVEINLGNKEIIRFRMRLMTDTKTKPVEMMAAVLKGVARSPVKRQWNMRVRISDLQRTKRGQQDHDPREFYAWIMGMSASAEALYLEANDPIMSGIYVFIEPPSLFRKFILTIKSWLGGSVAITLREA